MNNENKKPKFCIHCQMNLKNGIIPCIYCDCHKTSMPNSIDCSFPDETPNTVRKIEPLENIDDLIILVPYFFSTKESLRVRDDHIQRTLWNKVNEIIEHLNSR